MSPRMTKKFNAKFSYSTRHTQIVDRISKLPTGSFRVTKVSKRLNVNFQSSGYPWIFSVHWVPPPPPSPPHPFFFSSSIPDDKFSWVLHERRHNPPSSSPSFSSSSTSPPPCPRLKFTQLAKIILTPPRKVQPHHMTGGFKLYNCRVETRNDKNDGILNEVLMQQNYTDAGITEANASPNVYMNTSSFTKPSF